jgi:hypothetical protein
MLFLPFISVHSHLKSERFGQPLAVYISKEPQRFSWVLLNRCCNHAGCFDLVYLRVDQSAIVCGLTYKSTLQRVW